MSSYKYMPITLRCSRVAEAALAGEHTPQKVSFMVLHAQCADLSQLAAGEIPLYVIVVFKGALAEHDCTKPDADNAAQILS